LHGVVETNVCFAWYTYVCPLLTVMSARSSSLHGIQLYKHV